MSGSHQFMTYPTPQTVTELYRAPSIPDLLVAATAEKAGLTVLAVDKDFDLIAEITGQAVEALAFV